MTVFQGGLMTAFSNVRLEAGVYAVHFSSNGEGLGSGTPRYEGRSSMPSSMLKAFTRPMTAMTVGPNGLLTAFDYVETIPGLNRVYASSSGFNLGG